jgi:hypothetical protein
MDAKFYDELSLKSNWQTIAAGGPCNWQDGDAWAEVKDVTVTQGSVVASSGGSTMVRRDSDRGWWLDVSASGQFTPAPSCSCAGRTGQPTSTRGLSTSNWSN